MTLTLKTHGMAGKLVTPDWAPLAIDEVRTLLSRYPGLGRAIEISSVSPRPFSAACIVATENGRVFVKRHHRTVRDREGLLEEHRFMQHLLGNGATVPRILADSAGETAIEVGDWTYEVHEASQGVDLYGEALSWTPFLSTAHARSAGSALATLHRASEGFGAPLRQPRPLLAGFTIFAANEPAVQLKAYLTARPGLAKSMPVCLCAKQALDLLEPSHAELEPLLPMLEPLWTHNDLHGSNLLWSDDGPEAQAVSVIDFGLADRTNAVHDLAHAIERNVVEWLALVDEPGHPEEVPVHMNHLYALLDGYERRRPLTTHESRALAPMVALCHAEFALSEADYFLSVLGSQQRAAMAYDGWLVGHARWFRSASGKALLDALRGWAAARTTSKER